VSATTFEVSGIPVPQGSKKAYIARGRANVVDQNRPALSAYRADVAEALMRLPEEERLGLPTAKPVRVSVTFTFRRPSVHLSSKGEVKPRAPHHKTTRPDIDKLARAVLDALTGVAYYDDAQVVELWLTKVYGDVASTSIMLVVTMP
jgi:Holliday junction resolvase RusA-like endonuclease